MGIYFPYPFLFSFIVVFFSLILFFHFWIIFREWYQKMIETCGLQHWWDLSKEHFLKLYSKKKYFSFLTLFVDIIWVCKIKLQRWSCRLHWQLSSEYCYAFSFIWKKLFPEKHFFTFKQDLLVWLNIFFNLLFCNSFVKGAQGTSWSVRLSVFLSLIFHDLSKDWWFWKE